MAKKVRVPISSARSRLFELAETVRGADDAVVVLEQRGTTEHVALVREARLAYLEARVAEAEKARATPFTLAGSIELLVSADQLDASLSESRRAWDGPANKPGAPAPAHKSRRGARRR